MTVSLKKQILQPSRLPKHTDQTVNLKVIPFRQHEDKALRQHDPNTSAEHRENLRRDMDAAYDIGSGW